MIDNSAFGRALRLRRLFRHGDQRLLIVPLDHSLTDGPVTAYGGLEDLVAAIAVNGADAIVLHKGNLRYIRPQWFFQASLVVHLSASTVHAPDPDAKVLVATVEEAVRLGADAVSVHVNVGSREEARQVADLATVSAACDQWNLPLLAMVYPRGPHVVNARDARLVAHAVTIAADLGADIVKTVLPDPVASLAGITRHCPVPVLVAGGPSSAAGDLFVKVGEAIANGAAGFAVGRNIFQAPDPGAMTRKLCDLVHGRYESVDTLPGGFR